MSKRLSGEIHLGYFKQGDDLHGCLDHCKGKAVPALRGHAELLRDCAIHLDKLAEYIGKCKGKFVLDGDTHFIGICGPEQEMLELVKLGLVELDEVEGEDQ